MPTEPHYRWTACHTYPRLAPNLICSQTTSFLHLKRARGYSCSLTPSPTPFLWCWGACCMVEGRQALYQLSYSPTSFHLNCATYSVFGVAFMKATNVDSWRT